jgi:hypothetical protein
MVGETLAHCRRLHLQLSCREYVSQFTTIGSSKHAIQYSWITTISTVLVSRSSINLRLPASLCYLVYFHPPRCNRPRLLGVYHKNKSCSCSGPGLRSCIQLLIFWCSTKGPYFELLKPKWEGKNLKRRAFSRDSADVALYVVVPRDPLCIGRPTWNIVAGFSKLKILKRLSLERVDRTMFRYPSWHLQQL